VKQRCAPAGVDGIMDVYRWTVVAAEITAPPVQMGINDDRAKAQEAAGKALLGSLLSSRRGIVAFVEAVRPVLVAPGIEPGFQPTGLAWTGRRRRSGGVHWVERTSAS
jgi:hypothetical protein